MYAIAGMTYMRTLNMVVIGSNSNLASDSLPRYPTSSELHKTSKDYVVNK